MYSLCTVLWYSSLQTFVYTNIENHKHASVHVYTCLQMYIHVCTLYVHGMYILRYKLVFTLFRRVCTCLYYYVHVLNHINMYIQCTNLYIECCVAHVQCTDGYIHFMKCTDIAEQGTHNDISFWMQLFILPVCWPVGWDWLLLGVTPIQVQAHQFNQHQP
jgi:hypothetical protein